MLSTTEYVWNPNTAENSRMPMSDSNSLKKKSYWHRRRYWSVLIIVLIVISVVVLTTVFVLRARHQSQTPMVVASNTSTSNMTIRGLLTVDTIVKENICGKNETIEECVLVYNAKIIMNALALAPLPTAQNSLQPIDYSGNTSSNTDDCTGIRIHSSQLSQIFDPTTLEALFHLSGIPYSTTENTTSANTPNQKQLRTQLAAQVAQTRWTSPINYYINTSSGFSASIAANIRAAISHWQNNTCLIFNELPYITASTNTTYFSFQRDDVLGCSSTVGYYAAYPTSVIYISLSCGAIIGSIMHEIGHSLGYFHTHSRLDRDSYISVVTSNIIQEYASNFYRWRYGVISFSDIVFPYDFGSLMHYNGYGFTSNGLATIIPLDLVYEKTMGQRERGAFYDYKQMNRLYCATAACPQMFTGTICQNYGYLDVTTCSRCICPDGFSGAYCDQRDSSSTCGDTITNPTPYSATQITIQNPSPTSTTPTNQHCVYLIRSLSAKKIHLRLEAINTISSSVCILTSLVEVKYKTDLGLAGARWCGNTVTTAWSNVSAETNTMVVIFRARNFINITTGTPQASFRATILFDAEATPPANQTTVTTTTATTVSSTTTTSISGILTTSTSSPISSACPSSSFRCQTSNQPTCGGCMGYQPCYAQGTEQCTAYAYVPQLTNCSTVVNNVAQCQYQFISTPYTTTCPRTVLLCCPSYQLIAYQGSYFCVFTAQPTNLPSEWSLVL